MLALFPGEVNSFVQRIIQGLMPQDRGSQSLRFRRYSFMNCFGNLESNEGRKGRNLVGFEVRAESGSRFGPERLGGDDCHPLARCSATVNAAILFHVATIGSQRLPLLPRSRNRQRDNLFRVPLMAGIRCCLVSQSLLRSFV